jgi:hypothetical protein
LPMCVTLLRHSSLPAFTALTAAVACSINRSTDDTVILR